MKTHPLDFVLAMAALALVLLLALVPAALLRPLFVAWIGDYHVLADAVVLLLAFGLFAALLYRILLLLMPLRPGEYPMEHRMFVYWKLLTVIYEFGRGALLPFTTVFARPLVAKLFGARIGRNVALGGRLADPSLVTIGDDAILGHNSLVTGHAITSGHVILREVRIGRAATIGVGVAVMAGAEIGEASIVTAGAIVTVDARIPANEFWAGIPARKLKDIVATEIRG